VSAPSARPPAPPARCPHCGEPHEARDYVRRLGADDVDASSRPIVRGDLACCSACGGFATVYAPSLAAALSPLEARALPLRVRAELASHYMRWVVKYAERTSERARRAAQRSAAKRPPPHER